MNGPLGFPGSSPNAALEVQLNRGFLPPGHICLTLANDGTDATNDIAIAPGACRSTVAIVNGTPSTLMKDQGDLEIPASIVKQLDVSWAPAMFGGGGLSGLRCPGSSISDTTWHIYVVGAPGRQCDVLAVDSATQATVLAELRKIGFTAYRRIGSVLRESSALVAFKQTGNYFLRKTHAAVDLNNPGTSAVTHTLKVPVGIVVEAEVYFGVSLGGAVNATYGWLSPLDAVDETPSANITNICVTDDSAGGVGVSRSPLRVYTNTSGQVRSRLNGSSTDITVNLHVRGWTDTRDA